MALAIGANHEESLMFYRPQDGHPL
ncbi:MAG TPA: flavin reductase, partial [Sulfitobacter pontiacus]|nr:flavin reductase [Sulfitobacter pontiacus]